MTTPSTASSGGSYDAQSAVIQPFQQHGGSYNLGGLQSHKVPPPSLHDGELCTFQGLATPVDAINSESVMGI